MSERMDRQGARTPADLEQKYQFNRKFSEIMGIANDARDKAASAQEAYENLDQAEIFKRLTNGGAWQGVYYDGEDMYINASYIKSGEFLADLIKAGVLQSVDGETFKLDLSNGIFTLKSNGEVIMNVGADGATLAGWQINKDFLGTEKFGLNGNADITGSSEMGGTSPVRLFAGLTSIGEVAYVDVTCNVNALSGLMTGNAQTGWISLSECEAMSAQTSDGRDIPLDRISQLEFGYYAGNLHVYGILRGSWDTKRVILRVSLGVADPAFQVLEDGTLIAKHARIGGHSIDDLVARIAALERNS